MSAERHAWPPTPSAGWRTCCRTGGNPRSRPRSPVLCSKYLMAMRAQQKDRPREPSHEAKGQLLAQVLDPGESRPAMGADWRAGGLDKLHCVAHGISLLGSGDTQPRRRASAGLAHVVAENEAFDPIAVGRFGAWAVVAGRKGLAESLQEPGARARQAPRDHPPRPLSRCQALAAMEVPPDAA
jgi:hypothetical protein